MDKASIIKDAIDYIQELHDQERRIKEEIVELESEKMKKSMVLGSDHDDIDEDHHQQQQKYEDVNTSNFTSSRSKKKRFGQCYDSGGGSRPSPIEILEVGSTLCFFSTHTYLSDTKLWYLAITCWLQ